MAELQEDLPTGWECKLDNLSGKYYFVNHNTKTTTWEDPRTRSRHLHGTSKSINAEHIPLQHGSPDIKRNYVYPSGHSPIPAFQMPGYQNHKHNSLQEWKNITKMSPLTVRSAKVQDSSFSVVTDTDEAVAKISAMFPTVSETHIRLLMKKYHNREALVISSLQVDKYPITTPGPFVTPPPQRNIQHPNVHALQVTPPLGFHKNSRGGSPIFRPGTASGTNGSICTGSPRFGDGFKISPRPHSSPKLKLRYMKSIFPQAEETVILDILSNNDNNIQKTSEVLKEMGFQKKDTVKIAQQKLEAKKEEEIKRQENMNQPPPEPVVKLKTTEEKAAIKKALQEKYKDVAEHLINIALESVDYNEKRANQILEIMVQEDNENQNQGPSTSIIEKPEKLENESPTTLPISQSRQSLKSILKADKNDKEKSSFSRILEDVNSEYKSTNISSTKGANSQLTQGANKKNLLEDYVKWQGPNKANQKGPQNLAKGSNSSLLSNRAYQPCGSNAELRKGPQYGLAKGSIFSQLKNVVIGESRVK